jgi:UDP-N-acetylmuramate--alanine ligase
VVTNVTLDHLQMEDLRSLFGAFLLRAKKAVLNLDDPETRAMADVVPAERRIGYGFDSPGAKVMGRNLELQPDGSTFAVIADDERHDVQLAVPGRHNASNALAALAATRALGVPLNEGIAALARFEGLKRRLETVGTAGGVTVIDDFAHNPDKIDATLATLRTQQGRLLIMFQPHGFGPLTKMGDELAASFAKGMADGDKLYLPDPVYHGGTVDRARGSDWLVEQITGLGRQATHLPDRTVIGDALLGEAKSGDRIVIMGARDDSLSEFARELVERLGETRSA